ncbi:N-acetylglucosamine-6-phosphate deacetylase [Microvirga lotononidis]|uniref:N-acetylglucosamine-6-phosphate deacetylase n=1 Tax=Microvirga lotononidis TaxID=864069 RepID=I4Z2U3_9HYPH|nr:amidohydrolase family protein [Microvirga lotononidis]EIM30535.1 N-acetylglucosamine-6-phosphate deacetylase [Microvirga lotononidis]WQO26367.1 amidohydrolase family protein [Microvirga lotononidis]
MSSPGNIVGRDPATGESIAITVDGGVIAAIKSVDGANHDYLASGLIDLQVNGFAGLDLNDGHLTPERVKTLSDHMLTVGVTTFLPTLITAPEADIIHALTVIAEARRHFPSVARMVPFVHVEGPSISALDGPRGAHPAAHVRAPSLAEFERWQAASSNLVGLVTLAPELPGAIDYIAALVQRGVHVALGHTAASPEEIHKAAAAGASLSTHLGNGAAATLPRHPNFLWSQLADDRLTATLIADGHHLPADTFKAMVRAKGLEKAILVSDAVALAGMPPGLYEQPVGGTVEVAADGRVGIAGTPYLAGAGLPLCANVAIATQMAGLTLNESLRLATENPGRIIGNRGRLAVGAPADLIQFAWQVGQRQLEISAVWLRGEQVFSR